MCPRCEGLLSVSVIAAEQCANGIDVTRCVNCGFISDERIVYNQIMDRAGLIRGPGRVR